VLRNALEGTARRRTIEVLKLRGGRHRRGEHLFTVLSGQGMVVVPQEAVSFDYESSRKRLTSGSEGLDAILDGGLYDKSLTLVSGPTGVGKSLLTTGFVAGAADGERSILFSFEESRDQHLRNAAAWGIDLERLEADGRVRIVSRAPESATLEEHLLLMKTEIASFEADRVAVDSITALQRIATARSFHEYLLGLSFHVKSRAKLALVTATADDLDAGLSTGTLHLSTVADTVFLLFYVLQSSEIRRAVTVLKHRGSDHDKSVREYRIGDRGMAILEPLAISSFGDLPVVP
jgi:circadian clock protein KaiC